MINDVGGSSKEKHTVDFNWSWQWGNEGRTVTDWNDSQVKLTERLLNILSTMSDTFQTYTVCKKIKNKLNK